MSVAPVALDYLVAQIVGSQVLAPFARVVMLCHAVRFAGKVTAIWRDDKASRLVFVYKLLLALVVAVWFEDVKEYADVEWCLLTE